MTNEYEWAETFEQVQKGPRHESPRVVTVFKLPMTDDRRAGVRVSPNEYVEMFVVNPGMLTVQVRVDKKAILGDEPRDVRGQICSQGGHRDSVSQLLRPGVRLGA